jgi:hypothetical protein
MITILSVLYVILDFMDIIQVHIILLVQIILFFTQYRFTS